MTLLINVVFLVVALWVSQASVGLASNAKVGTLEGEVYWLSGDVMPGVGISMPFREPIVRTVYIYKATTQKDANVSGVFYNNIKTQLVEQVTTDEHGFFSVELPPGKYSVFTLEDNGLFANHADGKGYINLVTIKVGEMSEVVITIDYRAYY